jgi:hypothetical protein
VVGSQELPYHNRVGPTAQPVRDHSQPSCSGEAAVNRGTPGEAITRTVCPVLTALVLLTAWAAPARAQQEWRPSDVTGELAYLGFNTLAGAITAGIAAKIRGHDFSDAAIRGALGGAVVYAGKRIVVADLPAAGLVGRQVAAVGTSVVRNAGAGAGAFERLVLPLAVLRLHIHVPGRRVEAARLNLIELGVLAWAATRDELAFDPGASLASGAPVFDAPDHRLRALDDFAYGIMAAGVVLVGREPPPGRERVIGHELVHVLQHDFYHTTLAQPAESFLLRLLPFGSRIDRFIDVGVLSPVLLGITYRALESEADFLDSRR